MVLQSLQNEMVAALVTCLHLATLCRHLTQAMGNIAAILPRVMRLFGKDDFMTFYPTIYWLNISENRTRGRNERISTLS